MRYSIFVTVLVLAVALFSCVITERAFDDSDNYQSFDKARYLEESFHVLDSVKLDEEDHFFGSGPDFSIRATNYRSALTSMENGQVWVYGASGVLRFYFDSRTTTEGQMGKILITYDVDLEHEVIFVMYLGEDAVYHYSLEDKHLIKKVALDMPSHLAVIIMPRLIWNPAQKVYVVSTGYKKYKNDLNFYKKSKLISVFSEKGNYRTSFGEFPAYFTNVVHLHYWVRFFHIYHDDDHLYLSFGRRPQIYKYDYQGKLLETFGQLSQEFDYRVARIKPGQPSVENLSDMYYAIAKSANKDVYYYDILDVSHRGKNKMTFAYRLLKYDKENNTYTENRIPSGYNLLPRVTGDTLYFYSENQQYDEKYLVKAVFD